MNGLLSEFLVIGRAALTDRRGGIAIFMAFLVLPLCAAVGLALDGARGYLVKSRLSTAPDAAGLAAAQNINSSDLAGDVSRYFAANFPNAYMDASVAGPFHTVSDDSSRITLQATATIDTTFMRLFGYETLDVSADATVARGASGIDLVFAFDLSGSMGSSDGGSTRIAAARAAATQLVNHIFGDLETKPDVNVGLVPWNSVVNVTDTSVTFNAAATTTQAVAGFTNPVSGAAQSEVYVANNSPVPLLYTPPSDWSGCVFARYADDANSSNDGDIEFAADIFDNKDWLGWEPDGAGYVPGGGGGDDDDDDDGGGGGGGSSTTQCLPHGITPLQNSKSVIQAAIDELTSPSGNTVIPQGLAWAWRVLLPDAPFTEASTTTTPFRAVILLTDGSNCGTSDDAYHGVFGDCDASRNDLDNRLRSLAARVKADGVKIIAIQFANSGTDLQTLMQEVASSDSAPYYFYAPDGATLLTVFEDIGDHISHVRLVR